MFDVPFVKKNIYIDKNRIVNSVRDHSPSLKMPNPWQKQSDVITSIAAGSDDMWQDPFTVKFCHTNAIAGIFSDNLLNPSHG